MDVNNWFQNYYIEGFAFVISPGQVRDVTIYFKAAGGLVNIRGVDVWSKDRQHLGYIYPQNVSMEVLRAMRNYIRDHKKRWTRVYLAGSRD